MNANFNIVENYLYDKLSPSEKTEFEVILANSEELQAEVALQQMEQKALDLMAQAQLRANLKLWKAENVETVVPVEKLEAKIVQMPQRFTMRWAAAAAIVAVMFIGANRWASANYSDESLAFASMEEVNSNKSRGGTDNTVSQALVQAKVLMQKEKKQYQQALDALAQVTDKANKEEVTLLQARCYTGLKQYEKAIAAYQNIIATMPSQKQEAEWNLLLTYIAEGKRSAEITQLQKAILNNENHDYNPAMKELDKKLNSSWRRIIW
jgi:tetratricopeptide (TPR) repeat protein